MCELKKKVPLKVYTRVSLYMRLLVDVLEECEFQECVCSACVCICVHMCWVCIDIHGEDLGIQFSILINLNSADEFFCIQIPGPRLVSCVTSSKLFGLSLPWFPHLQSGHKILPTSWSCNED